MDVLDYCAVRRRRFIQPLYAQACALQRMIWVLAPWILLGLHDYFDHTPIDEDRHGKRTLRSSLRVKPLKGRRSYRADRQPVHGLDDL